METQNVFNGPALMLGSAAMLVCLLIQGAAVVTVMTVLKPRIQALARQKRAVMSHLLFSAGILALLISGLLGNPGLMTATFMPLALMVAAMFFASMLFSVRDCFSTDVYDEPPASADRPD